MKELECVESQLTMTNMAWVRRGSISSQQKKKRKGEEIKKKKKGKCLAEEQWTMSTAVRQCCII